MPRRQENVVEEAVEQEVVVERGLVADGAQPLGFLFVHLEVQVCVEALQVVASRCPTGKGHPHFSCRERERLRMTRLEVTSTVIQQTQIEVTN